MAVQLHVVNVTSTHLELAVEVLAVVHLDGVLVEHVAEHVELEEAQSDPLVRLHAADDLDTVDGLEGVLVIQQQPVVYVDQFLRRAHAHQAEHVVRDTADDRKSDRRT